MGRHVCASLLWIYIESLVWTLLGEHLLWEFEVATQNLYWHLDFYSHGGDCGDRP